MKQKLADEIVRFVTETPSNRLPDGSSPWVVEAVADKYGIKATGCGLCQTKVPCESGIPRGQKRGKEHIREISPDGSKDLQGNGNGLESEAARNGRDTQN